MAVNPISEGAAQAASVEATKKPSVKGTAPGQPIDQDTKITSLEQLKEIAPEVYQQTAFAIGESLRTQLQHAEDRRKQMQKNYST